MLRHVLHGLKLHSQPIPSLEWQKLKATETTEKILPGSEDKKLNPAFWRIGGFAIPFDDVKNWRKVRGGQDLSRLAISSWEYVMFVANEVPKEMFIKVVALGDADRGVKNEIFCITQAWFMDECLIPATEWRAQVDDLQFIEESDGKLRDHLAGIPGR